MAGQSTPPSGEGQRGQRKSGTDAGWTIFSYLIAGMIVYGGLGWLIGRWTGHPIIFPLGMLAGLALSVAAMIHRYGRS